MTKKFVRVLLTVSVVLVLSAFATSALAASDNEFMTLNGFPNKPIEVVTHSGVGGGGDLLGRAIIAAAQRFVPQPMVMVNANGATGNNMGAYLAEGKTDGHTIVVVQSSNPTWYLMGQANWNPNEYLVPIAGMQKEPGCFVVPASSKYQTLQEYLEDYKAGKVHIAGTAVGTAGWFFMASVSTSMGVDANYIPYSDGGELTTALIGAHVDGCFTQISEVVDPVRGGLLRILAFATEERLGGEFSEIPTFRESGVDFTNPSWRAFFMRAGTAPEHVQYWAEVLKKAHDEPSFQKWLADSNSISDYMGPEEFKKELAVREEMVIKLIKENAPEVLREGY